MSAHGSPRASTRAGTVAMVHASGSMSSSSSHSNGVDTCAPARARTDHAPNTVLCGAFWLKSTKIRSPALLLPPRVGDHVGSAAGELARDRDRGAADLDRRPPRLEARVHVDAAVARWSSARRGCRARRAAPSARAAATRASSNDVPGCGSRSMRSSSACSSSDARLGHTWKPRHPRFTAQTMCARSAATSALRRRAVRRAHHRRLQPVRGVLRHPLLEERRAADTVREPLHQHRAAPDRAHELVLDGAVVVDDVELGLALLAGT